MSNHKPTIHHSRIICRWPSHSLTHCRTFRNLLTSIEDPPMTTLLDRTRITRQSKSDSIWAKCVDFSIQSRPGSRPSNIRGFTESDVSLFFFWHYIEKGDSSGCVERSSKSKRRKSIPFTLFQSLCSSSFYFCVTFYRFVSDAFIPSEGPRDSRIVGVVFTCLIIFVSPSTENSTPKKLCRVKFGTYRRTGVCWVNWRDRDS